MLVTEHIDCVEGPMLKEQLLTFLHAFFCNLEINCCLLDNRGKLK